MKILIAYSTKEGQTKKIAEFMWQRLVGMGHTVDVTEISKHATDPASYDAALIGGSVHIRSYSNKLISYVTRNHSTLSTLHSAFFSVCMAIVHEADRPEAQEVMDKFLDTCNWKPLLTTHIAGAIKYTQYDIVTRFIMKNIAKQKGNTTDTSRDHEYTNWDEVSRFVEKFEHMLHDVTV